MSSSPAPAPAAATRDALLHAAGEVFAETGFRAATVRAICLRAGANIAAVNYHFGDKERLYLEVLRAANHRSLQKHPESFGVPPHATPAQRLRGFVRSFLLRLFDPEPGAWHWQLLAREMIQPTAALDTLVAERFRPLAEEVRHIVRDLLGPRADPETVRLSGSSIVGQCLFYRHCQSVMARLFPEQGFAPADIERLAEHITEFSLAGLRGGKRTARAPAEPARRSRGRPSAPARSAGARHGGRVRPQHRASHEPAQVGPVSPSGPHTSPTVIFECGALGERALPPRSVHDR